MEQLRTVGILIFDEVEVLDFCGPFEVFSVARPVGEHSDEFRLFEVLTIAEENRIITCRGGLLVQPQATIADHPSTRPFSGTWGMGNKARTAQPASA